MNDLMELERRVWDIYGRVYAPLADRLGFELPANTQGAPVLPSVLFLGNHSSGKSSFINFLLGAELQKTGLAPTDDGFTIITYGETADQFDGQTVVTHPNLPYKPLQTLGPGFLSHLRLKMHPSELLRQITLIDSPGMIDAAGTANTRGYDFTSSVRFFAETADLILFFFDPDKPGTTGETVSIFTDTLAGLEYKLLIVMNKVDLFQNIRDFARTYGTLSWNLAKTIQTKDIPHIFNTYLPGRNGADRENQCIPLHDFDLSREEVISEIRRTPTRRADNLVSDLYNHGKKLAIHARVCLEFARRSRAWQWKLLGAMAVVLGAGGGVAWFLRNAESWQTPAWALGISLAAAALLGLGGRIALRRVRERMRTPPGLDELFEAVYRTELGLQERADLRGFWESTKRRTRSALELLGGKIRNSFQNRRALRKLEAALRVEVPALRRGARGDGPA